LKTGKKLWKEIKNISCEAYYYTNCWEVYKAIIPAGKNTISKAQTYTTKSYNALFRHYPARFHRKTKYYS